MTDLNQRFTNRRAFAFETRSQDVISPSPGRNVLSEVALVVVEGVWDNEKSRWVDPPTVVSGFGTVRPERVAELVGIPKP